MPRKPEPKAEVPGWIISFSDMITLLLAFFVLLQSFAREPDFGLFCAGQASFRRAIDGLGIPSFVLGKWEKPASEYIPNLYAPEETADEQMRPVIHQRDEMIRERFSRIMQEMDSEAADNNQQPLGSTQGFSVAFDETGYGLTAAERAQFAAYADGLVRDIRQDNVQIYVVGFAKTERDQRRLIMLSARRAQEVATALRGQLAAQIDGRGWEVISWGGGTGVDWASSFGINADQASIAIAVMGAK